MPSNTKPLSPSKTSFPRPPLPLEHVNPYIKTIDPAKPPPVKFQEILRDGQATIVGRVKIPTPSGHAFILRRLDTGAVSLTTMFRAAFPTANEEAEKAEMAWVKSNFDVAGANKSGKARFAGTWVTTDVALTLAGGYFLDSMIPTLAIAEPDPNIVYRKSTKGQQQPTPGASPNVPPSSPSPHESGPNPSKRRREASPAHVTIAAGKTPPPIIAAAAVAAAAAKTPPPSARKAASPTPRRSTRLKSPAPTTVPTPLAARSSPRVTRTSRATRATVSEEDNAADDDDDEVAKAAQPNAEEDIQEQKEMIAKLKAERQAKKNGIVPVEDVDEDAEGSESAAQKRAREEDGAAYNFDFKEHGQEVGQRTIATNRRITNVLAQMPPERKSFAWGALAFAAGLGAVSLFPSLSASLSGFF